MTEYTLRIEQDHLSDDSPRDWDNLGTMVCWHSRYDLGDIHEKHTYQQWLVSLAEKHLEPYHDKVAGWYTNELWEYAAYDNIPKDIIPKIQDIIDKHFIMLPLYLYDHGSITMNTTGFSCPWDSGQVGFIYVSVADVKKEWKWQRLTKKRRAQIENYLKGEVKTYDQFLAGDVWGYVIEDSKGEHVDSCWGFYGQECAEIDGKHALDYFRSKENEN